MKKQFLTISIAIAIILLCLILFALFKKEPAPEAATKSDVSKSDIASNITAPAEENFINYNDPDFEKAFPDNLGELLTDFTDKTREDFVPVRFEDKNVPTGLIERMEKALYDKNIDSLDLGQAYFEISWDDTLFRKAFYRR